MMINPLLCFFVSEGHVALDRNLGPGYNILLLRLIPRDLFSACPHGQLNTLSSLLDSRVVLSNSYPNGCVQCREAVSISYPRTCGVQIHYAIRSPTAAFKTLHSQNINCNHLPIITGLKKITTL